MKKNLDRLMTLLSGDQAVSLQGRYSQHSLGQLHRCDANVEGRCLPDSRCIFAILAAEATACGAHRQQARLSPCLPR